MFRLAPILDGFSKSWMNVAERHPARTDVAGADHPYFAYHNSDAPQ